MAEQFPDDELAKAFFTEAIYTNAAGVRSEITTLFERYYADVTIAPGTVATMTTSALCEIADVSDVSIGATLEIEDVVYKVTNFKPDGTGLMQLILSKD